tara:strand:+ start:627 stop:845 length:219 start_codon:yes stop_codon:yes gene_type:complete
MAEEIESLKDFSLSKMEEALERKSKNLPMIIATTVHIEIDGEVYEIPEAVNDLLNSLYRMYEGASSKKKLLK